MHFPVPPDVLSVLADTIVETAILLTVDATSVVSVPSASADENVSKIRRNFKYNSQRVGVSSGEGTEELAAVKAGVEVGEKSSVMNVGPDVGGGPGGPSSGGEEEKGGMSSEDVGVSGGCVSEETTIEVVLTTVGLTVVVVAITDVLAAEKLS